MELTALDWNRAFSAIVYAVGRHSVIHRLGIGIQPLTFSGHRAEIQPTLELESGSNDPMAYVLTIAMVEAIVSAGELSGLDLASKIVGQLVVGGLLGYLFGRAMVWVVNHINLPNASLYPILMLSMVLIMFTFTDLLKGNGCLADMKFPEGTLVMMVKRGHSIIVPNGKLELHAGDVLLTIARQEELQS